MFELQLGQVIALTTAVAPALISTMATTLIFGSMVEKKNTPAAMMNTNLRSFPMSGSLVQ